VITHKNNSTMILKIKMVRKFLVTICISASLLSCSSDKKTWDTAKINNDIISYEYYIDKYNNGYYVDSAQYLITKIHEINSSLTPPDLDKLIPPVKPWNNKIVDSLKLTISISASQSKKYKEKQESKYLNILIEILKNMGIAVVPKNAKCNTSLIVKLNTKTLDASYINMGYLYTGYKMTGTISLTSFGKNPITLHVNKEEPCPIHVRYSEKEIEKLKKPDTKLESINIYKFIKDFLYKTWGPSPILWIGRYYFEPRFSELNDKYEGDLSKELTNNIIRACYSEKTKIRQQALELVSRKNFPFNNKAVLPMIIYTTKKHGLHLYVSLNQTLLDLIKRLGASTIEITPILINFAESYKDKGKLETAKLITEALENITGVNFNEDIQSWKKWWFYNKGILLDK